MLPTYMKSMLIHVKSTLSAVDMITFCVQLFQNHLYMLQRQVMPHHLTVS